jgi:hypothetical protein
MAPGGHPDAAGKTSQGALTWRTGTGVRRAALFASRLQRSDARTAEMAAAAIKATVRQLGIQGCVGRMAQEFGDHPETAAERMRWICELVAAAGPVGSSPGNETEAGSHHDCAAARSARLYCSPCRRAAGGVT